MALAAGRASADQAYKGMSLTVLGSNTDINELAYKSYGQKFEEDTGAKLVYITGAPPSNLSKAIASKGKEPGFQVIELDDPAQARAIAAGVLQKLDYAKLPNLANQVPQGFPVPGYGPALDFYRLGTCINVASYKANNIAIPTSIEGWFDPAIAGHNIFPGPANFWWLTGMQALAEHYKIPFETPAPLFERIASMKPKKLYTASGEAQAALQSGDIWLAPTSDGRCFALKLAGLPVEFIPLNLKIDGKTYSWVLAADTWDIPVGVTGIQLELAEKYIDAAITPSVQLGKVEQFGYAPTSAAALKQAMEMPSSQRVGLFDGFSFDAMYSPDAGKFIPYTSAWIAEWNKTFAK